MNISTFLFVESMNYIFFSMQVYHAVSKKTKNKLHYLSYCSLSQDKNFSNDKDSIAIGIELCNIPHISEH